jgi:very-short-patch-repair endonuclease
LAGRQHGLVAYWQLLRLGFGRNWIAHKVKIGWLHRVHTGVYAVGHPALTEHGKLMAAVLACGAGARLSHWRAARHWDLLERVPPIIDVVLIGNRTGPRNVRTHRVKDLHPDDRTSRHGIPITTVPRTLLDLAAVADERQLRRAVNNAARGGWLNRRAIDDLLERHPHRRGIAAFRAVVADVTTQTRRTRSDFEVSFERLCRKHGLPKPVINGIVEGIEVDAHFPGTNLTVELDSYEYHRTPYEFDQDRRRDAQLKKRGYEVLRVSEMWFDSDPREVAETISELLRGWDARAGGRAL